MDPETIPGLETEEPKTLAELTDPTSVEPVIGAESSTPETTTPEDEAQHYLRIDKRMLAKEIDRLEREDQDFRSVYNSKIGHKAAKQYQPQIEQLQREKADIEREAFRTWVNAQSSEDITKRFNTDPQFAKAYADLVHMTPQQIAIQKQAEDMQRSVVQQVESILDSALERGLPEETVEVFKKSVWQEAKYDEISKTQGMNAAIMALNRDIMDALVTHHKQPVIPVSPNGNTPTPNSALLTGSANTGSPASRKPGVKYTREEVEKLQREDPRKFLQIFPGDDDFENAIRKGEISGYEYQKA